MSIEENPFIKQTDYFAEYNESVQKLKNNPQAIELDKLCYEVFQTPSGQSLLKVFDERFLIPRLCNLGTPTFQIDAIWTEGFKEAFRLIKNCIVAHAQRIKSENKPA